MSNLLFTALVGSAALGIPVGIIWALVDRPRRWGRGA